MPSEISDSDEIPRLLDEVHDWWFEAENIYFDSDSATVTVPVRREMRGDAHEMLLTIENARAVDIEDTAMIGTYDLDTIEYDARARCVRLLFSLPFILAVEVEGFNLALQSLV